MLAGPGLVAPDAEVNGPVANGNASQGNATHGNPDHGNPDHGPGAGDSSSDEAAGHPSSDHGPAGTAAPTPSVPIPLALPPESLNILLESMPAAIGLLDGDALVYANSAFAYAFGFRSQAELLEAGGLDAILPGGAAGLLAGAETSAQADADDGPTGEVDALTRSRRRVKVSFARATLDGASGLALLRLMDQADIEPGPLEPPPMEPAPTAPPGVVTPAPATVAQTEPAEQNAANDKTDIDMDVDGAARRLDFLAKVSHEVRTPLNSILGFAELMLQERFGPIGSRRYKGYAEDIHQSGLYALSLLNDLLDISKIEAGKFELDFTAVDVAEVVETCVSSLQPLAKRGRIVLRTSLADDLPVVVADPRRLRQILLNLLTNAIKFTKEGGQVIVSGTLVEEDLRLRVRDSGVGMSEAEIAYAMQPFHQLDTTPRRQSGTGLGLPLTKALADAIRARLALSSEPGVGTSADLIFPAERLFKA